MVWTFVCPSADKSEGGRFSGEFEEASHKLQDYCECLGIEVNERINMVDMLTECKAYMSRQLAELQETAKVGPHTVFPRAQRKE